MIHWGQILLEEVYSHPKSISFIDLLMQCLGPTEKRLVLHIQDDQSRSIVCREIISLDYSFDLNFKCPGRNLSVRHNGVNINPS